MAITQLGKKGMFLTFISIAIIAAVIIIFTPSGLDLSKDIPVIKTRVSNVNEYVLDLENVYLENALKATGRKTLIGLIKWMENPLGTARFFTNFKGFEDSFSEVLLYGQIEGADIDEYYEGAIMDGNTYINLIDDIKTTAEQTFNVETIFTVNDIKVEQTRPWFVDVEADITFRVSSETASWNKNVLIKTEISVENFDDPYYLVNTGGSYINKIRKSDTKFDEWSDEKVIDFIEDGNYTHFEDGQAPSFLMRFYNDISASSCCGIESLVNPNNPSISNKDVSYVDYLYWSSVENCANPPYTLLRVDKIHTEFPNFKFDLNHLAKYKLSADEQICPPPG
jgi:hypothetical protein